jgi:putative ABC transport system permease protein
MRRRVATGGRLRLSLQPLSTIRILARSLAAFPAVLVMIAAVTVALALLATTLPRAIDGVISDMVRHDVRDASPLNRDTIAEGRGLYDLGPSATGTPANMTEESASVWGRLDDQLGAFHDDLPEPLRGALGDADFTAATVLTLSNRPGILSAQLGLRYDPRYLSRITITNGRAPENAPAILPSDEPLEVIAADSTAEQIQWSIGEQRPLWLNGDQQLVLVGTFTAIDADSGYWTQATATHRPAVLPGAPPTVQATVFANPVGFPAVLDAQLPVKSSVWYPADPDAIAATTAPSIAAQARQLATTEQPLRDSAQPWLVFTTGLPEVLEEALARSVSTQAVLTLISVSPIGLALVLEVLVARLAAERLRPSLALLAARGASRRQRLTAVSLPVLLLGLVAAAVGCGLGLLVPGGAFGAIGQLAVGVAAIVPALLLAGFTASVGASPGPERVRLGRPLRVASEVLVLLVTGAAVIATVQRGSTADGTASPGGAAGSVDLLAAAIPLLLSLLGCVVALRVYPVLVRRWLDAALSRRGIGAFVGLARAIRGGTAGLIPLLAMVLGVSVAVFSGLLSATLTTGLQTGAHATVAADISIENVRLDQDALQELRTIDGVAAVTGVAIDPSQKFEFTGHAQVRASVLLVDSAELAGVQAGVPGRVPLDSQLLGETGDAAPMMVSTQLSAALAGDREAELNDHPVRVVAAPLAGRQLGLTDNWVLIDRAHSEAIYFISSDVSTRVLVRVEPGASIPAVVDRLSAAVPASATAPSSTTPSFTTVAQTVARLSTNPAVREVHTAAGAAIAGAAFITSLALVLTLLLDGPARRDAVALLSKVGLSRRQGAAIVRWEIAPLSIAGLVGGALLGAVLSLVVLAIVDLRPFTGGFDQPAIAVNPWITGGSLALFAAVFLFTGASASRHATRRDRPPSAPAAPTTALAGTSPQNPGRTS